MYLMYVDESGDVGLIDSPTRFFLLTGLVVHELDWSDVLNGLIAFRRKMRTHFELKLREEIHAAHFINRPGALVRIRRHDRLAVLRHFAKELAKMVNLRAINVVVDKQGKLEGYDVFEKAWQVLIQRFQNTIGYRNSPRPRNTDDKGIIIPDNTDVRKLTQLTRRLRRHNPIPNKPEFGSGYRNLPMPAIVEDPVFRDSRDSYFIQACDTIAYLLYQSLDPCGYMRRKSGNHYFNLLEPILLKQASSQDPMGIVRL